MATMNVSFPDAMKKRAEAQAATGRYSNAIDDVRDLTRRDQERGQKAVTLRKYIEDAEAGGIGPQSFDEIIANARAKAGKLGYPE